MRIWSSTACMNFIRSPGWLKTTLRVRDRSLPTCSAVSGFCRNRWQRQTLCLKKRPQKRDQSTLRKDLFNYEVLRSRKASRGLFPEYHFCSAAPLLFHHPVILVTACTSSRPTTMRLQSATAHFFQTFWDSSLAPDKPVYFYHSSLSRGHSTSNIVAVPVFPSWSCLPSFFHLFQTQPAFTDYASLILPNMSYRPQALILLWTPTADVTAFIRGSPNPLV